jgi:hypothetical protein
MGLMVSGTVVIHVKSGHGVDPYFNIPMHRSMKGWRKKWFYLSNHASASLPKFIGCCPVPLPSWGDDAARKDLTKLQPMREAFQLLRQEGLMGAHLMWPFFSQRIQLLQQ